MRALFKRNAAGRGAGKERKPDLYLQRN